HLRPLLGQHQCRLGPSLLRPPKIQNTYADRESFRGTLVLGQRTAQSGRGTSRRETTMLGYEPLTVQMVSGGGRVPVPKVLIADDSPLVLRVIEKMLAAAGYSVLTARDGLEAIEKAMAEGVDLVILDVMMPRMNGYQACRILKTEPSTKSVPVVILTSKDQAGDRFWGLETGADYYITKDSEPHRILDLVRNVLAAEGMRPRGPSAEARTGLDILSRVNDI